MRRALLLLTLLAVTGLFTEGPATSEEVRPLSATVTSRSVIATILVDPLRVTLSLQANRVRAGSSDLAMEAVTNHGSTPLNNVAAVLQVPSNVVVKPPGSQAIGTLPAGATKTARWTLCAKVPGTYVIRAQASGQDAAGRHFVAYSRLESLIVTSGSGSC